MRMREKTNGTKTIGRKKEGDAREGLNEIKSRKYIDTRAGGQASLYTYTQTQKMDKEKYEKSSGLRQITVNSRKTDNDTSGASPV